MLHWNLPSLLRLSLPGYAPELFLALAAKRVVTNDRVKSNSPAPITLHRTPLYVPCAQEMCPGVCIGVFVTAMDEQLSRQFQSRVASRAVQKGAGANAAAGENGRRYKEG